MDCWILDGLAFYLYSFLSLPFELDPNIQHRFDSHSVFKLYSLFHWPVPLFPLHFCINTKLYECLCLLVLYMQSKAEDKRRKGKLCGGIWFTVLQKFMHSMF